MQKRMTKQKDILEKQDKKKKKQDLKADRKKEKVWATLVIIMGMPENARPQM